MSMLITNIQRSSFHDGPGIRTTVFLKGCMLHCPWCANPETISKLPEYYYDDSLCVRKSNTCICNQSCSLLINTPIEDTQCPIGAISTFGTYYSDDDLYDELIKDVLYYKGGGGITFSGGEPFLQLHTSVEILERLKSDHIHLCVETSLFAPRKYFNAACGYFDLFYVDIKVLLKHECRELLGGNIETFFDNLDTLFSITNDVIFRIPLIDNITCTKNNLEVIENICKKYKPIRVEYFDIHKMAEKKYRLLNKKMLLFAESSGDTKNYIKNMLSNISIESVYLKI
jgi:pyruvate formate lyase activating enzyme